MRTISRKLRTIVYALQNFDRHFTNLLASPTDGSAKCLVRCKAPLVPQRMSKTASKSMHNWHNWYEIHQKKPDSKFGALLWRRLTT